MAPKRRSHRVPWWEDALRGLGRLIGEGFRLLGRSLAWSSRVVWRTSRRRLPGAAAGTYRGVKWLGQKTGWAPRPRWDGTTHRDFLRELREEFHQYGWGHTTLVDFTDGERLHMRDVDGKLARHALDEGGDVKWEPIPHVDWHPLETVSPAASDEHFHDEVNRWRTQFRRLTRWDVPADHPPPIELRAWHPRDAKIIKFFIDDVDEDIKQTTRRPAPAPAPNPPTGGGATWPGRPQGPGPSPQDPPYTPRTPIGNVVPINTGVIMAAVRDLENLQEPEFTLDNYREEAPRWVEQIAQALQGTAQALESLSETANQRKMESAGKGLHEVSEVIGEAMQRLNGLAGDMRSAYEEYETPTSA